MLAVVIGLTLLSGCGKSTYEPVAIDETVDKCPICNMAVADDQFATEIILKNKKALKFDDLGDLHVWKDQNGTDEIGEQFVRDYNTKEWVKLSDATYVYDKSIRTPMAFNVISFKEKKDAETFVAQEGVGQILTAKELENHAWEMNEDMMKSMMSEHAGEMMDMENSHDDAEGRDAENSAEHSPEGMMDMNSESK
ncbi:nitrous oxide reductase accessory protein NosL [Cohnella thailandensis]|nr:nitrous oxide reductase accessory protein NosL [Cohnella thailandensis]